MLLSNVRSQRFGFLLSLILAVMTFLLLGQNSWAMERIKLPHDGVQRSYLVQAPNAARQELPLVMVLHGGGGNADNAVRMTGFDKKARAEGFIAIFPEGSSRFGRFKTWNSGHCCAYSAWKDIDDIGFLGAVLDDTAKRFSIDPNRIYVTGMSNGAMMAHRMGREMSGRIAAIAPVVGTLFGDEVTPRHPVAALIINGTLDKNVPMAGGLGLDENRKIPVKDRPFAPTSSQLTFWAKANGCTDGPHKSRSGNVTQTDYQSCKNGADVRMLEVHDNGHAWPGGNKGGPRGDEPSNTINATNVIWEFFASHPKQ
jgi:polyhydroxybutyrate depolymerase